jgi:hypothetical protein
MLVAACEDPPRATADASAAAPSRAAAASAAPPPVGEGCVRSGPLEAIESDPACVLPRASDDVMRDLTSRIAIGVELDPPNVVAGSTAVLRVTLTNVAKAETLLVFDAHPRGLGPRPDWSRLAGVPDVKGDAPDLPRLQMPITTLDANERPVDAVPVVATTAAPPSSPRLLGVRLRPGAKLVHTTSWWALRIPAPAPIVKDDAGHRFVPKTTALPLSPGEYVVAIDVPLHGLAPAERTVSVRAHVERATVPQEH